MFVTANRGLLIFAAFPPLFPVLRIYHFNLSFFEVNINDFLPSLLWLSDFSALNPINPCHGWCFILIHSFRVAIPSEPLTPQVFSYILYLNYLCNIFISDFILQSFSTHHSQHSHYSCFDSILILRSHGLSFSSIAHSTSYACPM